ncbi:Xaa-Pro aminopeptidase [Alishewanella tabrizica]|uniref:Xaa-Pro aminopeptidase n=1 Tax=Alishewanella tabrizica TaxID=671278 RepID=A0ABQ2WGB7_9ALTE|nr:Xaa-Pro aminopeptidase [Alishewanella tabrizica]GGW49956.1 Xaa-Pro aminopeptidase [Alishewanella tabrizica]
MQLETYLQRRQQLLNKLPVNSVVLVPAATEHTRSRDTEYPFRQHSDFWYYIGFNEPEALLILSKDQHAHCSALLLCRDKDPFAEMWQGRRLGPEAALTTLGLPALSIQTQHEQLSQAINGKQAVYLNLGEHIALEQQLRDIMQNMRQREKRGDIAPVSLHDLRPFSSEQRLIKDNTEISLMRRAANISSQAHHRAMRFSHAGAWEYQLEAEILHEFAMQGARFPAYNTIVGSGENGCVLHYIENAHQLKSGDLVLIDAGCELLGYAADISRTFPVNGVFSPEQAALYKLVLEAQLACIAAVKPGASFAILNAIAERILTEGLLTLGILQGELDTLIENKACKQYFMHGIGHWLGLDVHDVGAYKSAGQDRPFEPGMVLTIEPGLYISSNSAAAAKWWGLAIRIEDNILVTESGAENLTAGCVKTVADIEQLMQNS